MANKWEGLENSAYRIEDLGRPAIFLLPSDKLGMPMGKTTVRENLHGFLAEMFGGFSATRIPYFLGFWRDAQVHISYDECCLYEVSFVGKELIPVLFAKLADIARAINEKCIYCKAGQYACLLYPKP